MLFRPIRTTRWHAEEIEKKVDRALVLMERYRIGMVTVLSSRYPPLLRELHEPPFALFWRGTLPDPDTPVVAIVLSLIHISEPTRLLSISYAVFCLKKKTQPTLN